MIERVRVILLCFCLVCRFFGAGSQGKPAGPISKECVDRVLITHFLLQLGNATFSWGLFPPPGRTAVLLTGLGGAVFRMPLGFFVWGSGGLCARGPAEFSVAPVTLCTFRLYSWTHHQTNPSEDLTSHTLHHLSK